MTACRDFLRELDSDRLARLDRFGEQRFCWYRENDYDVDDAFTYAIHYQTECT